MPPRLKNSLQDVLGTHPELNVEREVLSARAAEMVVGSKQGDRANLQVDSQ